MPKVALVTDTHAGVRSEGQVFFDEAARFYKDVFFPEIDRRGIKTVVHLGDIVDRRKYVAFVTANRLRTDLIDPLVDRGLELIALVGNHDVPYRDKISVNAQRELLPPHPRVRVIDRPQVWQMYDLPVLLLPWICHENREASLEAVRRRGARVAMGHLELAGFEMYRGIEQKHGLSASVFDGYELVMSGHYHEPSQKGVVRYLGAPFEMYWHDYGCDRGFYVFDTETLELEHVRNSRRLHVKLFYDDSQRGADWIESLGATDLDGKIVKVVVQSKSDLALYDKFIDAVEKRAHSVQVVEDHRHADAPTLESLDAGTGTLDMLMQCAETAQCDRDALGHLLRDLYFRALEE